MNDNAKKWVAALRSGKYRQEKGALKKYNCYCCLGVACELYQQEVGDLIVGETESHAIAFDNCSGTLPPKVQNWLELETPDGRFEKAGQYQNLAALNDNEVSFEKIAEIIELEPKGLFGGIVVKNDMKDSDRYQFQPWYIKACRWLRWRPLFYLRGLWITVKWVVKGAKPESYPAHNYTVINDDGSTSEKEFPEWKATRRQTLKTIFGVMRGSADFEMGYYYTADEVRERMGISDTP